MSDDNVTVLVTGATGNQGSAVARHLLDTGKINVRCLVRDPSSQTALNLNNEGAELVQGDFDDQPSLHKALKSCHAVYLNTLPGLDSIEVRHTRNVLCAAKDEGVAQVICSTVCRAGEHEDFAILKQNPGHFMLNYWQDKAAIEKLVKGYREGEDGTSWTLLQPAWLMSNFIAPAAAAYWGTRLGHDGVLETAFAQDSQVQLTSGDDVGAGATAAILAFIGGGNAGDTYAKQTIRLAGDVLTMDEVAAAMSDVSGRQIQVDYLGQERVQEEIQRNPVMFSQQWARVDGTKVDMQKMKSLELKTLDFKMYLQRNRDALIQAVQA